jgi:hypothetical protein
MHQATLEFALLYVVLEGKDEWQNFIMATFALCMWRKAAQMLCLMSDNICVYHPHDTHPFPTLSIPFSVCFHHPLKRTPLLQDLTHW